MRIFKHSADRLPITCILSLTALDFALYFLVDNLAILFGYYFVMIIPKSTICSWNHHHQHISTFRYTSLNRILEFFYALHTGVTTNLWRLHHVLGHHVNFLDQSKDESRWQRKDGTTMNVFEYTLIVALSAYPRGYAVGKRYPKHQKPFLIYGILCFAIVTALTITKPLPALALFILPMVTGLLFTAYATYDHHSGLDTQNQFEASYNNLNRWYNLFTGNLGYHTAHHYKQGLHWSKLPDLHARIADKIPAHLYQHGVISQRG